MAKEVTSEVTGKVWKMEKQAGERVEEEDIIMILESMKMEIPVEAPCNGTLLEVLVNEEDAVEEDQVVAIIEAD